MFCVVFLFVLVDKKDMKRFFFILRFIFFPNFCSANSNFCRYFYLIFYVINIHTSTLIAVLLDVAIDDVLEFVAQCKFASVGVLRIDSLLLAT